MSSPTGTTSDLAFGSQDIVLGTVTWTCNAFKLTFPTGAIDSNGSFGVWRGSAYMDRKPTGTMSLKYPAASPDANGNTTGVTLPATRTLFTAKTKDTVSHNLIISEVSENQGSETEPVVSCNIALSKTAPSGS